MLAFFKSYIVSVVKSFRKTTFGSLTETCVLQDINQQALDLFTVLYLI